MQGSRAKDGPPEYDRIDLIIKRCSTDESGLIAILQEIESLFGYLPVWALKHVSEKLSIPLIQVYGVASFYDAFHLTPQGKNLIRVCLGTACYLKGSARVLEALEKELEIKDGETTSDLEFSLQSVRCLGACALAPVMMIGDRYFDKATPAKVGKVLKQVRENVDKA
jgi:NADH-quinone oxidoreductase subunit E